MNVLVSLLLVIRDALFRQAQWPDVSAHDLGSALDEALVKFPNDRINVEARAMADLAFRDFQGMRRLDA